MTDDANARDTLRGQMAFEDRAEVMLNLAQPGAPVRPLVVAGYGRREAEQSLLVDALTRVGTSEAAFALRRLREATTWTGVRDGIDSALQGLFGGGEDHELFAGLATIPSEQKAFWARLEPERRSALAGRLEAMLTEIDQDVRARGSAYLGALRQALIRFPLVAWVGGSLEDHAAQRFGQLRSNLGREEAEALELMRPERARDYVRAALRGEDTHRARLALGHVKNLGTDLELGELAVGWVPHPDDEIARSAIRAVLVSHPPATRDEVRALVKRVPESADESWSGIVRRLLDSEPRLPALSLGWVSDPVARLFIEVAGSEERRRATLEAFVLGELEGTPDADHVEAVGRRLQQLARHDDDALRYARAVLTAAHAGLRRRRTRHRAYATAVVRIGQSRSMREGLWKALSAVDLDAAGVRLVTGAAKGLAQREDVDRLPARLAGLLAPAAAAPIVDLVVDMTHDEVVSPRDMAVAVPEGAVNVVLAASTTTAQADRRRLESGEDEELAAQFDDRLRFLESVQPLVEQAAAAATGNDRLAHQYSRLTEAFERAGVVPVARAASAASSSPAPAGDLKGYLQLDRASAGATPSAQQASARRAAARVLGESGDAAVALTELFEGGPRQRLMARLSQAARDDLYDAARVSGFSPPTEWIHHAVLGEWLARRLMEGDTDVLLQDEADARTLLSATLDEGARIRRDWKALSRENVARRSAAKADIARLVAPVLEELDLVVLGYARVRRALGDMGWEPVEDLGSVVPADATDPSRHRVVGEVGASYLVRGTGLQIDGRVVLPATIERADDEGEAD